MPAGAPCSTDRMKRILLNALYPVLAVAVLLVIWAIAAAATGESLILPSPVETAEAFGRLLGAAAFWRGLLNTFVRALIAYAVCLLVSLLLAAAARLHPVRRIVAPIMTVVRSVPTMAVIFLLLLWTGARAAPVYVAVTVMLPTMYAGFTTALDGVDRGLIEMSAVYRVPMSRRLLKLYLPSLAPPLVSSATFLSLGVKLVVAAEALAMTAGSLGMLLMQANTAIATARLMAIAIAAVLVGFLVEGLAKLIEIPLKKRGFTCGG